MILFAQLLHDQDKLVYGFKVVLLPDCEIEAFIKRKAASMKKIFVIYGALVFLCNLSLADNTIPYLSFRSASVNAAREIVGWESQINRADIRNLYGSMSITPSYSCSMSPQSMACWLFNPAIIHCGSMKDCLSLKVQGSKVAGRDSRALLADYFYLPTDFQSKINILPEIDIFLADFNFYIGFGECFRGLYLTCHAPVVYTRWDLGFCESNISSGSNAYDPGYFTPTYSVNGSVITGLARTELLENFEDFVFYQKTIENQPTMTFEPLRCARMSPFRLNETKLSEIQLALGYNLLFEDDYYLGLQLRGSIPTGSRPTGEFLFEPIVGNGHHGELGMGVCAHWRFWQDACCDRSFGLFLNAYATHLFATHQRRTFDLKGKPLSRYMLAMRVRPQVDDLLIGVNGAFEQPTMQFKNVYAPVANFSTINVFVGSPVQLDIALKCAYIRENIEFDLGYNLWYRSCERIRTMSTPCCPFRFEETWALKGDSFVFGFPNNAGVIAQQGAALSATQSDATIFQGTNNYPDGLANDVWNQNAGIDKPMGLGFNTNLQNLVTHDYNSVAPTWQNVYSSLSPVLIKEQDLDIQGARTGGLSHKIFAHFNYTAWQCHPWTPYIGFGGELECGKKVLMNCCSRCALSQWSIWVKAGLSFEKLSCG